MKVLFWGVIGAVVFRGLFIFLGVAALNAFEWLFIVFGLFLIYTGVMLIFKKEDEGDIEKKFIYRFAKKHLNFTSSFEDGKFFVVRDKKILFTPLFLCLLVVEFTDIVFAIDSIPAVLGITTNLLVVYTSNIFAVMGLRSMYFALAGIMPLFAYLKYGLSIVLSFIGLKMILKELFHISVASYVSLAIVLGILVISIALSLIFPPKVEEEEKV
jgi:tellurite resistance protein TerC